MKDGVGPDPRKYNFLRTVGPFWLVITRKCGKTTNGFLCNKSCFVSETLAEDRRESGSGVTYKTRLGQPGCFIRFLSRWNELWLIQRPSPKIKAKISQCRSKKEKISAEKPQTIRLLKQKGDWESQRKEETGRQMVADKKDKANWCFIF